MQFQFDANPEFQQRAVAAVADVFQGMPLVPCAVGVGCFLLGAWRAGLVIGSLGAVLLALSFPSRSEMNGYHD